jgi:hypothetical protein
MAQTIEYLQGSTVPPGTYYLGCLEELLGERFEEFYKTENGGQPTIGKCRVTLDTNNLTHSVVVLNLCSNTSFNIETDVGTLIPFNSSTSIPALVEADLVEQTPELEAQKFIFTQEATISISHGGPLVMSITSGDRIIQVFQFEEYDVPEDEDLTERYRFAATCRGG